MFSTIRKDLTVEPIPASLPDRFRFFFSELSGASSSSSLPDTPSSYFLFCPLVDRTGLFGPLPSPDSVTSLASSVLTSGSVLASASVLTASAIASAAACAAYGYGKCCGVNACDLV